MGRTRHAGTRYLVDEPLRVAAPLVGQPLASPARRLAAIVVDWLILAIPTLIVVAAAAGVSLYLREPAVVAALRGGLESTEPALRQQARGELARFFTKLDAPGLPGSVKAAVLEEDIDRAATLLDGYEVDTYLQLGGHVDAPPAPRHIRFEVEKVIPKALQAVVLYGVAALYFTLFTASRRGATLGKRLLGIRVVHLAGRPLRLMESLERFVGYLHIPGTLGLAFLDLRHDPNRRMGHDRVAHTAVLRVQRAPAAPGGEEPVEPKGEEPVESPTQTRAEDETPSPSGTSLA
jgi:hypothetical protein